jgi:hypothetical protein
VPLICDCVCRDVRRSALTPDGGVAACNGDFERVTMWWREKEGKFEYGLMPILGDLTRGVHNLFVSG